MYESFTYLKGTVSVVCAEQGPEEMAHCLQHTQQEFGFIVTEDTKCVAFPWTSTQHMSLCTSMWLLGRNNGTGLNIGRKCTVFNGEACYLELVQSTCGWAMISLIKALSLSFQGEIKKEKEVPIICLSGKDKAVETIKRSVVGRSLWRDEYTRYRSVYEQWKYFEWHYNDGYMSLCVCAKLLQLSNSLWPHGL